VAKRKTAEQTVFTKNGLKLKDITPLTTNQSLLFQLYDAFGHLFISGCPGTGKSFLSIYLALREMATGKSPYRRLIIMRSVVPSREMGFLPGTAEEKAAIYEAPYISIFADLFGRADAYDVVKESKGVEFMTTSFLRGVTFKDCIVIVDELQNMQFEELNTVISRVGENCKIIFSGDLYQSDLNKKRSDQSGFNKFKAILGRIPSFGFVTMEIEDIVRSQLAKQYIIARIQYEEECEQLPTYEDTSL